MAKQQEINAVLDPLFVQAGEVVTSINALTDSLWSLMVSFAVKHWGSKTDVLRKQFQVQAELLDARPDVTKVNLYANSTFKSTVSIICSAHQLGIKVADDSGNVEVVRGKSAVQADIKESKQQSDGNGKPSKSGNAKVMLDDAIEAAESAINKMKKAGDELGLRRAVRNLRDLLDTARDAQSTLSERTGTNE